MQPTTGYRRQAADTYRLYDRQSRPGIVIVAVYMIDLPALPGGVLHKHRLLVPDAAGVIGFALLISVLLGQAAVNSCFHAHISFQEIEQAISAIIIP